MAENLLGNLNAMSSKLNKNKIVYIIFIGVCLLVARNIFMEGQKEVKKLTQRQDLEEKKNSVLNEIGLSEKKLTGYKKHLNIKDAAGVLESITNLAKSAGVKINSMKPQIQKDYPLFTYLSYDMNINSDKFHKIGRFIVLLENDPYMYFIENLGISNKNIIESSGASIKVNADITVGTLLIKEYKK